jgi:hypothetical protein
LHRPVGLYVAPAKREVSDCSAPPLALSAGDPCALSTTFVVRSFVIFRYTFSARLDAARVGTTIRPRCSRRKGAPP